eukprot:TRINITY_DN11836_c0_g1_i4.p1 TRINITY_DN11836_c0_g1~~TRINITY_DN11836_c0_g1_i4.p1  ORF type:complete len:168 (-),score=53.56 TRINITY_DN11836_c0_g1_i4:35-538(-)
MCIRDSYIPTPAAPDPTHAPTVAPTNAVVAVYTYPGTVTAVANPDNATLMDLALYTSGDTGNIYATTSNGSAVYQYSMADGTSTILAGDPGVHGQVDGSQATGSASAGAVLFNETKGIAMNKAAAISDLSLIHISEPTRLLSISYAVFCLKKKKKNKCGKSAIGVSA